MNTEQEKNSFLGIGASGEKYTAPYKEARTVIIPFGFEATVSYGGGTKQGPKAIIEASRQVEVLNEENMTLPWKSGIATLKEPIIPKDPEKAFKILSETVKQTVDDGKFFITLGGEHSITQAEAAGFAHKWEDFSILHFDAHSDTRDDYHDSKWSHASVMNRILSDFKIKNLVQVGIRSISAENNELAFRRANKDRIKTFFGWENPSPKEVARAIKSKNVFISFDIDAFDSALMPATGTPEPGGLEWWQTLEILKEVFKTKNVFGADVVELAPMKGLPAPDFLTARLVYKMIGMKFGGFKA